MQLLQLIKCAFGKHRRSRRHVRQVDGDFYSNCEGCGCPMMRGAHGWVVEQRDKHP